MRLMHPAGGERILDVGVTDTAWRSGNFLEANYPWPQMITAVALKPMPAFQRQFPGVDFVVADGRALPFENGAFDIGFSNAVVEHVGSRDQQAAFVGEMLRTCSRVFIATPNARFPIDPHTLLPFIHWLSPRLRYPLLRLFGQSRWAREEMLNPLSARALLSLFPRDANVRLVRQRFLGLTTVLIAVASARDTWEEIQRDLATQGKREEAAEREDMATPSEKSSSSDARPIAWMSRTETGGHEADTPRG